jgi:NADH:ubiquinone oxidoreductase subunit 3 (subunit A)
MDKISTWRSQLNYATLILTLILFELILSIIFSLVGHLIDSAYFRGVGIGLIISWVTSALAYFIVRRSKKEYERKS